MSDDFTMTFGAEVEEAGFQSYDQRMEGAIKSAKELEKAGKGVDKQYAQTAKSLKEVARQGALKKAAKDAAKLAIEGKDAAKAAKELAKVLAQAGASEKEVAKITAEYERQTQAIIRAKEAEQSRQQAQGGAGIVSATERFDVTSRQVALAGDVESNVRTVGGAIGAFGGTGVEGSIARAAEIPAVIEALPRLQDAIAGMPETITKFRTSLGLSGKGMLAAGGAAIALAVAMKVLGDEAQKQVDRVNNEVDQAKELARIESLSLQELQAEREKNNQTILEEKAALEEAEAQRIKETETIQATDLFSFVLKDGEDAAEERKRQSQTEIDNIEEVNTTLEARIALLQQEGATATELASQARARVELEQELATSGVDATNKRAEAINQEKAAIDAELQSLKASGDTSEETTKRIAELEKELEGLGAASQQVGQHLASGAAAAVDAAEKAAQASQDARAAQVQAVEQTSAANKKYSDTINKLGADLSKASSKLSRDQKDARDKLAEKTLANEQKAARQLGDKRRAIAEKTSDALLDAEKDRAKALEDLNDDIADKQASAIESRNFKALAALEKEKKDETEKILEAEQDKKAEILEGQEEAIDSLKQQARIQKRERDIAANKARSDLLSAQRKRRSDLRDSFRQRQADARRALQAELKTARDALNEKLKLERDYYSKSVQLARRAGGGWSGSPRSSSSVSNRTANVRNNFNTNASPRVIQRVVNASLSEAGL